MTSQQQKNRLRNAMNKLRPVNQLTANNQGYNHGQQQPQQKQSSSDKYIEQLKREYLQENGSEQTIKDVN